MQVWPQTALFVYMLLAASSVSRGFNIDTTRPDVHSGEKDDFFGYKVLQFTSGPTKGIIATAPLQFNGSGAVCRPDLAGERRCFNPKELRVEKQTLPLKGLGLSIAEDPTRSQLTVCSPHVAHECDENSYLNSVCYKLNYNLKDAVSFTPAFQKCTKKVVNLVFLFDGSSSMGEEEFNKNKEFILDMMKRLNGTSIKFAAVQFGSDYRTVFTFNDYTNGLARKKMTDERHMMTLTNTFKALRFLLTDIFDNPDAGASPDATKVLVLITDGNPTDEHTGKNSTLEKYDRKSIIRFVIGVKIADMKKVEEIASEPKSNNTFKIENYNGLQRILEDFQKHIFSVEGTKEARAGEMTKEMSQSGFSLVSHKGTLIVGSVGSNSWRGALHELQNESENEIKDPTMEKDSYMGYSIAVGERNQVPVYCTGAPRFRHIGQMVLFKKETANYTVVQKINGDRIGSYFGAELCLVDIDSNGDTDFVLVGAPMFYAPDEQTVGQVYVYSLSDELQLKSVLNLSAPSLGRFGTTIASLADLNGDALRDVAVGAPLEEQNAGAVYIFLGDRQTGIRSTFSQKIPGRKIGPGLRFFGQAIDGNIDLGEDGLTDIVVGSQGTVIVFRSRPVFNAEVSLEFQPAEISTDKIDCPGDGQATLPMVDIQGCFQMTEMTKSKAGAMDQRINISYILRVDPVRQTSRGFFIQDNEKERDMRSVLELKAQRTCFNYSIFMPICVYDMLSPISIKLNYWQVNSEESGAVLNVDNKREALVEVPFKRECRNKAKCVAELEVDFNFTTPVLLVAEDSSFNMTINLANRGDDSYNTSLTLLYPAGLSFSIMTAVGPTLHSCPDSNATDRTTCGISLPVFRRSSVETFLVAFHILTESEWNSSVSFTAIGKSDNSNTSRSATELPVKFEIKLIVKESSMDYIDFTEEDFEAKTITAGYTVNNPGWKAFPVNVSLLFPTKLAHDLEMKNYNVTSPTQCRDQGDGKSEYCSAEKQCRLFSCDSFILERESSAEFHLTGQVQFTKLRQQAADRSFLQRFKGDSAEVQFRSFLQVHYDKHSFALDSGKQSMADDPTQKSAQVRIQFVIAPDQLLISVTGTIVGLLLLVIIAIIMFKMGCFKRKTMEYYQEQDEGNQENDSLAASPQADSTATAHQPQPPDEEKALLEAAGNNNQSSPEEPELLPAATA